MLGRLGELGSSKSIDPLLSLSGGITAYSVDCKVQVEASSMAPSSVLSSYNHVMVWHYLSIKMKLVLTRRL